MKNINAEPKWPGPKGRTGAIKLIIIIALVLVLIVVGGAVALKLLAPGLIPGSGTPKSQAAPEGAPSKTDPTTPPILQPLKPFIVNLVDPMGKRYLKITMTMELDTEALKTEVEAKMPQIQDAILILLSSLTFDDIRTVEGKMRLRGQIISRCNTFLTTGKVKNIYFSEFVVQ